MSSFRLIALENSVRIPYQAMSVFNSFSPGRRNRSGMPGPCRKNTSDSNTAYLLQSTGLRFDIVVPVVIVRALIIVL